MWCVLYCMFKGREHITFTTTQMKFGNYPHSFTHIALAWYPYVTIANLLDKTHQLKVDNSYCKDIINFLCFPINDDNSSDFGGNLKRFVQKLWPGQIRMHCQLASEEYIYSNYQCNGNLTSIYYTISPLGMELLVPRG
jgi:hypothetical protein